MSLKATWYQDKLKKKAKRGFQGYPIATVTFYGPNDQLASKVSVGIIQEENGEVTALERWLDEVGDIRKNGPVIAEVLAFIAKHSTFSVISPERILGCPHEEGSDYPIGEKCPKCAYWANRDRFTGKLVA
ncbi:hypothetical protein [Janthinobacterium sp. B9-8]|uniref:hypothetical protein n=1 Tax=Janthinobacterium sp. B9-8 TaxID=1236179 RepID=UPI00061D2BA6|nr:hypothetical protein [Janthinobacterium sp. B9-8]AMC34072.1 hypothetical protein VN23_05420 [Janthinobacterium sp. B9-8]